jgi:ribosomal protein S18 acetylase RimI-like enzyme
VPIVRRVRSEEWRSLRELRLHALAGAPRAFSTTLAEATARREDEWRELGTRGATSERWATFVADEDGSLVGMATGSVSDDEPDVMHLMQMWVEPAYRRRGLGRSLVDAVLTWGRDRASTARLDVVLGKDAAVALYTSLGFRDTGRRARVRDDREDSEMEMERPTRGR